ncbi:hypothetical protein QCA50_019388 [Cerrena zonata]|uniref:G-protein coupled receptors family 1 profile domain-containing protein n=1 Tax=Cerrena zonata TaxID=2478898 RepID=A0AAW0FKB7_9APHY
MFVISPAELTPILGGSLIALDTTQEINCQSLYIFNQLAGNAAVGLASINLALRTMALWGHSLYIVVPLVLVILGHWTLILQGVLLKAAWVDGTGCVITHTNNTILAATFIYSMCLDLVVLLLSGSKLIRHRTNSQLTTLLFKDGLIYFIVAFVSNLIATIFMCLNLSSIMSVIFNVPAAIASTIVACRAVRRLSNWASTGVHVYSGSRSAPYIRSNRGPTITTTRSKPDNLEHGVHIQMETVTEMVSDLTPRGYEDSAVESDFKDYVEHKSVPL